MIKPKDITRNSVASNCSSVIKPFEMCESPAEMNLLHLLWKADVRVEQQYKVGRYRLDAVTGSETFAEPVPDKESFRNASDVLQEMLRVISLRMPTPFWQPQVGWEIDGKRWHDESRDAIRDKWIIDNSEIEQIVRIPAAALLFFRDACICGLSHKFPAFSRFRDWCRPVETIIEEAEHIADEIEDGHCCESIADEFAEGECVKVVDNEIFVGSPVAFLPEDHRLLACVSRPKLNRWLGRILIR